MVLGMPNSTPMLDGHAVSRSSDFIVYSVEAEFLEKVVEKYGPCMYPISAGYPRFYLVN